ncbi:MAG: tetratricopeptide repeat protein, partial [Verrucomicrobia bacterium]|nr:tetratricopeptide repeat protein [Verrucomicrobiota bacterium]
GSNSKRPGARPALAVIVALLAGLPAVSWAAPAPAESKMIVRSGGDEAARNELRKERELRLQRQDLEKQIADYDRRLKKHPDDLRLSYNKGTCEYAAGDYQAAEKELTKALSAPDLELQHRSYYNLGNTRYRLGADAEDPKKKMEDWQQAVSSYESALKLDSKDDDARFNLDLVKKKLEELKQQQQKNQDQQQNKDQQNKDQQDKSQQQQQNKDEQKNQQDQQQKQQDGQQKKDDSQQQQQNKDDQKKQQDQQQKQDQSQQQQAQKSEGKEDQQKDGNQDQEAAQAGKMVRMTPQQARQLLDAQRAEEKPMPFWKLLRTNRVERVFKDW